MEISKRRRSNALFEDSELVINETYNETYNEIVNSMNNININSNSQLLYQFNLKINDLEKKIDKINLIKNKENEELYKKIDIKMDKKIEELTKKIDDIFRDKEYTIDRLNEEIIYLKSKISEYENSHKTSDYYM
jgi:predicted HAD superfamily phosphohydrolase